MSLLNFFGRQKQLSGTYARNEKSSRFQVDSADYEEDSEETVGVDIQNSDAVDDQNSKQTYEILEREILPAKIICPDCGGITLEGLEFCDKCGGELQ